LPGEPFFQPFDSSRHWTRSRFRLRAPATPTRAEPGCLTYDLYQSPVRKNQFMRYEVWQNAAALEEHKATSHIQASFALRQRQGWTTEITVWNRVPEDKQ